MVGSRVDQTFEAIARVAVQGPGIHNEGCTRDATAPRPQDWPGKRMLGEFLSHKFRTVRRLERAIDEIKRSPENCSMRDFDYL